MIFLDFPKVRGHEARFSRIIRKPARASSPSALELEKLEDRLAPATITFAQFIDIAGSAQAFAYTNNSGSSADFDTFPGGEPILLSFDTQFAPSLTTPRNAHLFLTSHTIEPTLSPLPPDNAIREHFPVAANTIQIDLDTPVDGKTNFLTVTYSDLVSGLLQSNEASLKASDAASGTPPDMVTFASDFINFGGTTNHGFSLSFSSVNSSDGSGGLRLGAGDFFKSFTAAGTGTFDTNFSGQLGGQKFADLNGNGKKDPGEPGLAGWRIFLDGNGVHRETLTAANGNYNFADLNPGTYRVSEEGRPGWVQTTVSPGDITVVSGADITGVDFGNQMTGMISPLIPVFPLTGPPPPPPPILSKLELFAPNLPGMENGLLAADSAYVGGVYQNLLNRSVDAAGLTHWLQALLTGASRQQVAMAIWQSPEHRGAEVDQFYGTYLGRSADAAGRASWVNAFLTGSSEVDVIRGFLTSAEYQATHTNDVSFVNGLYTQVLGRAADPAGAAVWLQALQSGLSRQALAQAFLTSAEADRRVVDEYYILFLNRPADPAGEQLWTNLLLHGGATFESVGETFLASDEYFSRAASP